MSKTEDAARAAEDGVRTAAAKLKSAIDKAADHGLRVTWPDRAEHLDGIAVTQAGQAKVIVQTIVDPSVPVDAQGRAHEAAQAAAGKASEAGEEPGKVQEAAQAAADKALAGEKLARKG